MITVEINSVDVTDQIEQRTLQVTQNLTYQVDTAFFNVRKGGSKTLVPSYGDEIEIYDGSEKILGGTILSVNITPIAGAEGEFFVVNCVDRTYEMDKLMAAKTYEDETIEDIIADLVTTYASAFTTVNVNSTLLIEKIVFNQVPLSVCIKRLADTVGYDWYVDSDRDIHFFSKDANSAPFGITDTNGNYVYNSLNRVVDGSQVVNTVKVRGGEYNGNTYSDQITVSGNNTKSFKLPYRFANLTVTLDTGGGPVAQTVGLDFIDDFTSKDVLHNFQDRMIRFETALSSGDIIAFTGNPKVRVFTIAEDPISKEAYGVIEKLIRDGTIESNAIARRRASAELFIYSEPIIDAKFTTYTTGLRTGMIMTAQSDIQGFEEELMIKSLTFKMRDHDNFQYEVSLVSTRRYDFITLLQQLIEPDAQPSDENETSEQIYADTQVVTVQEEYEVVAPFEDEEDITVSENYILNPLGAGVDALYTLSPYTPSGQLDTRRPGRLGISFRVY
ncbi:hypothetical protein DRQ25_00815 [Candidatus Fermentibacteria bacterium]|nr:MAG: hypothetical protein DRQ25_00815 [Candidatus Fermentibacteria bacterium]